MRTTTIGCGYLGTTHAACMAELGYEVLGLEVDPAKLAMLRDGKAPVYEPGLADLLAEHVASGRLRFTDSYEEAAAFGEIHFLCLGTPQRRDGMGADVSQVEYAVEHLAPHLTGPRCWSASPPCRSAPPSGWPTRWTSSPRPAWAPNWPGTPSSSARASPSRTP